MGVTLHVSLILKNNFKLHVAFGFFFFLPLFLSYIFLHSVSLLELSGTMKWLEYTDIFYPFALSTAVIKIKSPAFP